MLEKTDFAIAKSEYLCYCVSGYKINNCSRKKKLPRI